MTSHSNKKSSCLLCSIGSKVFGHGLTHLLGKKYNKVTLEQINPYLTNLNLIIVGGLKKRGHTEHDIDVVGNKQDVTTLIQRLTQNNIHSLVHYCGPSEHKHSHMTALINGFGVIFFGNKIYFKDK